MEVICWCAFIRFVHNKEQRPKERMREKKFFCSLCGKAFLCPSSLAMHCRTHTGDKPYSCQHCGQGFAQAGNLKKHLKRWHEDGAEGRSRYELMQVCDDSDDVNSRYSESVEGISVGFFTDRLERFLIECRR